MPLSATTSSIANPAAALARATPVFDGLLCRRYSRVKDGRHEYGSVR
jgi:hypothetical protein